MNDFVEFIMNDRSNLFYIINSDDIELIKNQNVEWVQIVTNIYENWESYITPASLYYEALYEFNKNNPTSAQSNKNLELVDAVNKKDAQVKLTLNRPTGGNDDAEIIKQPETPPKEILSFNKENIRPGKTPARGYGRPAICFYKLFTAFIGTQTMGLDAVAEAVHHNLNNNPTFARFCGFNPEVERNSLPSYRMLQKFDQIMSECGIWHIAQLHEVNNNLDDGFIKLEKNLVHDTTHYMAYSSFETVKYEDEKGKDKKKSQSKTTKNCTCENQENCEHLWGLTDDGAGTVVKHGPQMHWAHKASILGVPDQGIPLVALAMTDAANHDSKSIIGSLEFMRMNFPNVLNYANSLLDDSAADVFKLKNEVKDEFNLTLNCTVNPKGIKTLTSESLPKGMEKLTPRGVLICQNDCEMQYNGIREEHQVYIYSAPCVDGQSACSQCPFKDECCNNNNNTGRVATIPFSKLPHILPENPPMRESFKKLMKKRPSVERMIYKLKCRLGERYLHKRGNCNFQATLDKSMIALHLRGRFSCA